MFESSTYQKARYFISLALLLSVSNRKYNNFSSTSSICDFLDSMLLVSEEMKI
jgi:hypothetical protein